MAVAILDNPNTVGVQDNANTNVAFSMTVSSGANRVLVVLITLDSSSAISPVTWDAAGANQAMTVIPGTSASNGTVFSYLYGLVNPTPGASKVVTVGFTTGTPSSYVSGISYTGVNQTGGATTFPHGTTATGTSGAPLIPITSAIGNFAVGVECDADISHSVVGQTQVFESNAGFSRNAFGNTATGASTVTLTGTLGSSAAWCYSGCDIAAVAAPVTPSVPLGILGFVEVEW